MDNPETLTTLGTQDTGTKTNKTKSTTQKTKKMSNTDATRNGGEHRCSRKASKSCLLYKAHHITHTTKTCLPHHYIIIVVSQFKHTTALSIYISEM